MILLGLISFKVQSQDTNIFFDHYNNEQGLSNKVVTNITQDEDGFIWIATREGLNRFDGKDFVKYYSTGKSNNLPSSEIYRLACLAHHCIAVGTPKGLGVIEIHSGKVLQLIIPSADELKNFTNGITDMIVDGYGSIIITTYEGLYVFDSSFRLIFRHDEFSKEDITKKRIAYAFALDLLPDGNVLVPAYNGYFILDMKRKKLENIEGLPENKWQFLKAWKKKTMILMQWNPQGVGFLIDNNLRSDTITLYLADFPKQNITKMPLIFPGILRNEISWKSRIFFFNDSIFTIKSSKQNGLYIFHFNKNKTCAKYTGKYLPDMQCNTFFVDRNKRIWIGTDDGLFKQSFSKTIFHNVQIAASKKKDIENTVNGFAHIGHQLFVSINSQGILNYDEHGNFRRRISFENLDKLDLPWSISKYKSDSLLVPTQIGALLFNPHTGSLKKFWDAHLPRVIDSVAIPSTHIDSHHQLWMGLGGGSGVFMINIIDRSWKLFSPGHNENEFPLRYPRSINEDINGNIWMSGAEGITRWNWTSKLFDTLITKLTGIAGNITGQWIYHTIDANNNMWICPDDFVLIKFNLNNKKITVYHQPENVGPCKAFAICGPWNKNLWMQTNIGLLAFSTTSEKFTLLKKTDGLPNENTEDGGLYFDSSSGRIYAGFTNAFTWFYPDQALRKKEPPLTYITDIRQIGDSSSYLNSAGLQLPYNRNSISISYTGINFDDGELNSYAYRLYEDKAFSWIHAGSLKMINFANLKPGKYTFQVKTILLDGTESVRPASISITISPPFYQTWWYYTLCIISILFIAYMLYRYRINQLIRVQKVRDTISSDLHDDIGAKLTNMNILTMLGKQNIQQRDLVDGYLNRIGNEIQSSGEALDDIVWSINRMNDSISEMVARMRRYAADIFDTADISFKFNGEKPPEDLTIGMEQRRDLFLVYKEAITNIQKHAHASEVLVNVIIEKKVLYLTISDDGDGFTIDLPNHRNGLKNMRQRIEKWKGSFAINSLPLKGTVINISFAVKRGNL